MKLFFESLKRTKKRMNEAVITDYIDMDKLSDIVFNRYNQKFGNPFSFKALNNMFLQTIYKSPDNDNYYDYRYWKFIKNDDGLWEVSEVDQVGKLVDPVVNFIIENFNKSLKSKERMNENLSSLNDFLDELNKGCGTKKEADALYRKAKETLGKGDFGLFVKEYAQTRNRLSESKKRMNEDAISSSAKECETELIDIMYSINRWMEKWVDYQDPEQLKDMALEAVEDAYRLLLDDLDSND